MIMLIGSMCLDPVFNSTHWFPDGWFYSHNTRKTNELVHIIQEKQINSFT